ncbi:prominin-1-A-like isoform X2 [Actinia tenebrosa]|uniref:Prominin-1-A-like isoform X2 n=1 Tax=Actinia tenebrosa TaxID=6105 RepID=A0A6P8HHA2_ACTTE|nr:prominin-1-A-like isoform X2 [Actinia tenebrosa]
MNFGAAKSLKVVVFVLYCQTLVEFTACSVNEPRLNGKTIEFLPLYERIPYRTEIPPSQWMLSSYEEIARKFSLALREDPPYDVIKGVLKDGKISDDTYDKIIKYEIPFFILASISLLGCVMLPMTGLIFFFCRCCGKCGGNLEEENMEFSPVKQRQTLSILIFLCSVFILIGSSCIFLSNDRLGTSVPLLGSVLQDSIDDIIAYRNNTIQQLEVVAGSDMKFTTSLVVQDLNNISQLVAEPVMIEARKYVRPLLESIINMGKTMVKVNILLDNINETVNELQDLGDSLRHQLNVTRQNLTDLKTSCQADPGASMLGICDNLTDGLSLVPKADYTKIPSVSKELERAKEVSAFDMAAEARKGNETLEGVPKEIENTTHSKRQEVIDFVKNLSDAFDDITSSVRESSHVIVQDTLVPLKKNISTYFGPGGMVEEYDTYRFLGMSVLACTILFTILLIYCGLSAGMFGARDYDTPSTRSTLADCGGKALMWAVGFFFSTSLFVNLLLGVLFLVGANITVVCKSTKDLTLLEKTIDDNSIYGYYPISKMLFNDGTIDIQLSDVLRGCGNKETPWTLLKMDNKFNLENLTNYADTIPSMDEIFQQLNSTIVNVSVVTAEADKKLNDSISVGVHHIDFTKYADQFELPLINGSLIDVAFQLRDLANAARNDSPTFANKLEFLSSRHQIIHYDIVDSSSSFVNILKSKVKQLEEKGNETLVGIENINRLVKDLEGFLGSEALAISNKAATAYLHRIIGWLDQYIDNAVYKYRNEVGECSQMKKVFDASASVFCDHVIGSLNSLWMSFGIITLFSFITLLLCINLANHYRRATRSHPKKSRYSVPLSLFNGGRGISSGSRKRSINPWNNVHKNTPIAEELTSLRWV